MCDIIINETMDNLRRPITTFCIGGGGSHLTRGSVAFNHMLAAGGEVGNCADCTEPDNELSSYQKLAIHSIQAAKTSISLPSRNGKPANLSSTPA